MNHHFYLDDDEFAMAIASSAHAIHALEEASTKEEPIRPPQPGSIRRSSGQDTKTTSFMRPPSPIVENPRRKGTSRGRRIAETKSDAWERSQLAKIHKRYQKMHSNILSWENEKKLRAKQEMERKKQEVELRKSRNLIHYKNKISRIDHISNGAKAQLEEKRKYEESLIKEKARRMKSIGKAPISWCCF
ncbi:Remorin family protein [Abeliophyllum distichum]|uniref:Remorin family protein n=1 Tax=Abeliophyllum distichum TaxID=126358 RepID=A0ABD1PDJ9_9LAMI